MAPTQIYGYGDFELTPITYYVSTRCGREVFYPAMITRCYSLRSSTNSIQQKEKYSKVYPKHHKLKGVKKPTAVGTKPKSISPLFAFEKKIIHLLIPQVVHHKNVYYLPK